MLRNIQQDGATSADLSIPLQDGHAKVFDSDKLLLESLPDASSIIEVAAASAVDESAPKESSAPISKYVTLRNAFTAVDNGPLSVAFSLEIGVVPAAWATCRCLRKDLYCIFFVSFFLCPLKKLLYD